MTFLKITGTVAVLFLGTMIPVYGQKAALLVRRLLLPYWLTVAGYVAAKLVCLR